MAGNRGLFTAKSAPRPSAATSQRLRSIAFLSAAVAMLCLYKFVLIPRITRHSSGAADPYLDTDEHDPASVHLGDNHEQHQQGSKQSASEGGGSAQRQASGGGASRRSSGPSSKQVPPVSAKGGQKAASSVQRAKNQKKVVTQQAAAAAAATVHQAHKIADHTAAAPPPQAHSTSRARQESFATDQSHGNGATQALHTSAAHHHGSKEEVLDADMAKASSVVDSLTFPKTQKWTRRVKRVIVNKEAPDNKNAKNIRPQTLPDHDLMENKHTTCAVIGNGGVMLSKKWGLGIDMHDAVFRFNDGPTVGFEKNVGSKTTYRLINNKWTHAYSKKHPRGASEENIVLFGHGSANLGGQLGKAYPDESVIYMAPEFAGQARGQYKTGQAALTQMGVIKVHGRNSAPTGIEGIFMALAICQKVHLYGFGIEPDPNVPYHYHDKVRGVEAAHSFGFQALLLKLLNYKGIFGLCVPGHDMDDCMDPRKSDLGAYESAVRAMAAAAEANPDKDKIAAAGVEDSAEDVEEAEDNRRRRA